MSLRFAVVHEAEADFLTATELADRVLLEAIDWLDDALLAAQREWVAHDPGGRRLTWKDIKQWAREAGIRAHGHFEGEAGLPDAAAARRAILLVLATVPAVDAIVLIRDQDDQPERRLGLEQARKEHHGKPVVVVGVAVVERECWVVSGFEPTDEQEQARLAAETSHLGFDPRTHSHGLTACKNDSAKRSAKRVLRALGHDDRERERRCWCETDLSTLRQRGTDNGLAAYLEEVRDRLAGLIGYPS